MDVLLAFFPGIEVDKTGPSIGASAFRHDFVTRHRCHRVDPFNGFGSLFQLANHFVCIFQRRPGWCLNDSVDGALVFVRDKAGGNLLAHINNAGTR